MAYWNATQFSSLFISRMDWLWTGIAEYSFPVVGFKNFRYWIGGRGQVGEDVTQWVWSS